MLGAAVPITQENESSDEESEEDSNNEQELVNTSGFFTL